MDNSLLAVRGINHKYIVVGEKYVHRLTGEEVFMLPGQLPAEVMCHGDFAPYNITFVDGCVHGIIDFDTLHPGPRIWDVAYAVYRWIPFVSPKNPDYCYNLNEQVRRLKLFADTYDLKKNEREELPNMIIERISSLVAYMRNEADSGNEDVWKNIEDGHLKLYLDDIQYIKEFQKNMLEGIL